MSVPQIPEEDRDELIDALVSAVGESRGRDDFDQCDVIADELIELGWRREPSKALGK